LTYDEMDWVAMPCYDGADDLGDESDDSDDSDESDSDGREEVDDEDIEEESVPAAPISAVKVGNSDAAAQPKEKISPERYFKTKLVNTHGGGSGGWTFYNLFNRFNDIDIRFNVSVAFLLLWWCG